MTAQTDRAEEARSPDSGDAVVRADRAVGVAAANLPGDPVTREGVVADVDDFAGRERPARAKTKTTSLTARLTAIAFRVMTLGAGCPGP